MKNWIKKGSVGGLTGALHSSRFCIVRGSPCSVLAAPAPANQQRNKITEKQANQQRNKITEKLCFRSTYSDYKQSKGEKKKIKNRTGGVPEPWSG
jgi:hypothetical protein